MMFKPMPKIVRIEMRVVHADGVDEVVLTGDAITVDITERQQMPPLGTRVEAMLEPRREWDLEFKDITHMRIHPMKTLPDSGNALE